MKNWIIYVVLLFAVTAAGLRGAAPTDGPSRVCAAGQYAAVSASSRAANAGEFLCEPTIAPCCVSAEQAPPPAETKGCYFFDPPLAARHTDDGASRAYISRLETFPASQNLSQLHRLNI